MSERMRRRLEAVESKTGASAARHVILRRPNGLDDAAYAAWHAAEVAPARAAGARVLVYGFVPWPPRSGSDVRDVLRSSVAGSPAELATKIRALPPYAEQAAVLAELGEGSELDPTGHLCPGQPLGSVRFH